MRADKLSGLRQKPAKTAKVLPGFFVMAKRLILGRVGRSAKNDRFWRASFAKGFLSWLRIGLPSAANAPVSATAIYGLGCS